MLTAPWDIVLDQTNVLQPDMIFVAKERLGIRTKNHLAGAPDLAVEILSPSTAKLDRSLKLRAYEDHGVAHYWILDPDRKTLEERVLTEKAYRLVADLSGNTAFRSTIFPTLAIELEKVWCGVAE